MTACLDWESRLVNRQSIIPEPLYPEQAAQALAIFRELRVVDLPGKPTFGECSAQWVFDFVAAVFGAYDAETGIQKIREYGLCVSKKNAKSSLAAGIMLTACILCWREYEEHLILAPTKEVADNSFKPAAGMVRSDPELSALFHVQDHIRTIRHRNTNVTLKVVAADTDTVSGKKSGRVLVDELWLFGKNERAGAMFMEATGGQISRPEGWVIYLTTQSDDPPAGVFKEKLNYWRDVRDGKVRDQKTLGVLYEFPRAMLESKAYMDPANFYVTNPNIGRSVSAEWLEDKLRQYSDTTDGSLQKFLAKHLNVEIGLSLHNDRWPGAEFWEQCADPSISLDEIIKRSEIITFGIDGGGLDDMLGAAAIGRERDTGRWLVWAHAWLHPIALERRKSEAARYRDFEADGDLSIVANVGEDVDQLVAAVEMCEAAGVLDRIGVDQAGIGSIVSALEERGIAQERIIGIPQGWKMNGAIKTCERRLAEKTLIHCGRPLMAYCVGNAKVQASGNAVFISKQISGVAKIDPLLAMFNAATLMSQNPQSRRSFWDA